MAGGTEQSCSDPCPNVMLVIHTVHSTHESPRVILPMNLSNFSGSIGVGLPPLVHALDQVRPDPLRVRLVCPSLIALVCRDWELVDTTLHTVGGGNDTQKFIKFRLSHWI